MVLFIELEIASLNNQALCLRNEEQKRRAGDGQECFGEHEGAIVQEGVEVGAVEEGFAKHDEFIVLDPQQDAGKVMDEETQCARENHSGKAPDPSVLTEQSGKPQHRKWLQLIIAGRSIKNWNSE